MGTEFELLRAHERQETLNGDFDYDFIFIICLNYFFLPSVKNQTVELGQQLVFIAPLTNAKCIMNKYDL